MKKCDFSYHRSSKQMTMLGPVAVDRIFQNTPALSGAQGIRKVMRAHHAEHNAHLDFLQPRIGRVHRAALHLVHDRAGAALRLAVDKHVRAGGVVGGPLDGRDRRRWRPVHAMEPQRRLDVLLDAAEILHARCRISLRTHANHALYYLKQRETERALV